MITSAQDLKQLIPPALRYRRSTGTGGLQVIAAKGGVWVQHRGAAGNIINFTAAHHAWFRENLPKHLPPHVLGQLFGFTEKLRQRQGFAAHQSAAIKEGITSGAVGLESLEENRPLTKPLPPDAIASEKLPRAYSYVKNKPEPARRFIFFREFAFRSDELGRLIRPDEIVASYPITDAEKELIKQGKSFAEIAKHPEASRIPNLLVHSGDINRPIGGDSLVEHFGKTMDGAVAAVEYLKGTMGLDPQGTVRVSAKDTYLEAQLLRIKDDKAAIVRHAPAEPHRKVSISMFAELTRGSDGKYTMKAMDVNLRRLAGSLVDPQVAAKVKGVISSLENVLSKVAKMKK